MPSAAQRRRLRWARGAGTSVQKGLIVVKLPRVYTWAQVTRILLCKYKVVSRCRAGGCAEKQGGRGRSSGPEEYPALDTMSSPRKRPENWTKRAKRLSMNWTTGRAGLWSWETRSKQPLDFGASSVSGKSWGRFPPVCHGETQGLHKNLLFALFLLGFLLGPAPPFHPGL